MTAASSHAPRIRERRSARHEVEVEGSLARYWIYAADSVADAPTVVAVHGFRGDHHGLEAVIAHLPGVRVIAPDLPGFGETPALVNRMHDLDTYARWLSEFVTAVAPGATILGHSFGSIVTAAAVAGPLDAPALILVNPIGAPALEGPKAVLTRLAVWYYGLGARLPQRWGEALLRSPLIVRVMSVAMTKTRDRPTRQFIHQQHDAYFSRFADRDVLRQAFLASVSHDVREFAPAVSVPTLLVAAVDDDITPIRAQRRLVSLFPRAELVEIADVGHLIHYEKPAEAAHSIERFLRRRAERGR